MTKSKLIEVKIWVNADKGFYRCKSLDKHNREYLIDEGYKLKKFKNIYGKTEKYLLKPKGNEGFQHCFLVNDIFNYVKNHTSTARMFLSVKPDIVFESNDGKYAVEVETGKTYTHAIKKLKEKVKMLKKEYGNKWFFVVTNRNFAKRYKKLGVTYEKRNVISKISDLFIYY